MFLTTPSLNEYHTRIFHNGVQNEDGEDAYENGVQNEDAYKDGDQDAGENEQQVHAKTCLNKVRPFLVAPYMILLR
jgi:hypothetical protein